MSDEDGEHDHTEGEPQYRANDNLFGVLLPEARMCVLAEDLQENTYIDIVRGLTRLALRGDADIYLHILSPGGDLYTGLALADAIEGLQTHTGVKVVSLAMGMCASAAIFPYFAGNERRMGRRSWLMVHGVSMAMIGADMTGLGSEVAHIEKVNTQLAEWFAARTKHPVEFWAPILLSRDPHYWSAEEALKDGLADAII